MRAKTIPKACAMKPCLLGLLVILDLGTADLSQAQPTVALDHPLGDLLCEAGGARRSDPGASSGEETVKCVFTPSDGTPEQIYSGSIGTEISARLLEGKMMHWVVRGPNSSKRPPAAELDQTYSGGNADSNSSHPVLFGQNNPGLRLDLDTLGETAAPNWTIAIMTLSLTRAFI